jgi:cytochrome c-type biogenesis protein CcmH/NrfG
MVYCDKIPAMTKKFFKAPVVTFVVVLFLAVIIVYLRSGEESKKTEQPKKESPVELSEGVSAVFQEKTLPLPVGVSIPDLNRSVPPGSDKKTTEKIMNLSLDIKKDPSNVGKWIDLGLWRRNVGDFEGAKEAWEYANLLRPNNPVILGNLGVVYGYDLGKVDKAENYFIEAIKADPLYEYVYIQVHNFYRDVKRDNVQAKKILEQGVKALPNSLILRDMLKGQIAPF